MGYNAGVRAFLLSPLGFLIGLSLGALGGGGSILAVPVLVYGAGQDPRAATATSLLLVGVASVAGLVPHWRAGRVRPGIGVAFGLAGIGGSVIGSHVNASVDPDLLLLGFSGLILLAAWRMLTGCPTCTRVGEERVLVRARAEGSAGGAVAVLQRVDVQRLVLVALAGTGVGFLTGLFGVGGGFVIVPALALVLELPMPQAIGTSLLVIAINSATALGTRMATTTIEWEVALPFTIAAVLGVLAGERLASRLDPQRTLRAFATLLLVLAAFTASSAILALR